MCVRARVRSDIMFPMHTEPDLFYLPLSRLSIDLETTVYPLRHFPARRGYLTDEFSFWGGPSVVFLSAPACVCVFSRAQVLVGLPSVILIGWLRHICFLLCSCVSITGSTSVIWWHLSRNDYRFSPKGMLNGPFTSKIDPCAYISVFVDF